MTEKIIIRLKHVGTNRMALPVTSIIGPAPMPDIKVGERFHIKGTPDDVWWEVTALEVTP